MSTRANGRPALGNIRIGKQLAIGFGALSLVVAATGASGLFFANQIAGVVGGFTESASPLLNESYQLLGATEVARVHVLQAVEANDAAAVTTAKAELA